MEGNEVKPKDDDAKMKWKGKAKAQSILVSKNLEKVVVHLVTCATSSQVGKNCGAFTN